MKGISPSIESFKNANFSRFMLCHESRIKKALSLEELAKRRRFGMPYRAKTVSYQLKEGFLTEITYWHCNSKEK
ncbi:hypothetical protein BCT49_22600 [Vibrio lentus]|uniref:Uncharacterized protein n=1 Tax=Vibrio lentus TaxID=136468 RepID=A0A2N7KJK6_9VIBR|nr:hypothetical protein BCT49_22600 [Vibrio lentus]